MKPSRNDPCPCGSGKKYKHCCERKTDSRSDVPSVAEFDLLVALFNSRRYAELEDKVQSLLVTYPNAAFAWQLLGGALQMQGKDALDAFRKTVELSPNDASAHYNLGVALKSLGQLDNAVASYRRALVLKPDYVEALSNLGNAVQDLGQLSEAVQCYQQALVIQPNTADTHNNLGTALRRLGNLDAAVESYGRALEVKPDNKVAARSVEPGVAEFATLGALFKAGHFVEVENLARLLVEQFPKLADVWKLLGVSLHKQGQGQNALPALLKAIEILPADAEAHYNLGITQASLGQLNEAAISYRKSLALNPDLAAAHNNLGDVLQVLGEIDSAAAHYRHALALKPDYVAAYSNLLFCQNHSETINAQALFAEHCRFAELFESPLRAHWTQHKNSRDPNRCLQIGFVSGDLYNHAVANFIEPVLAHLAQNSQLSLHAYYNHTVEDSGTQRLRGYFEHWHSIFGLSDDALAQKIRADSIDILYDLSGHTGKNRILTFARKPAPVQVSWCGYPCTTGLSAMDYFQSDRFLLPEGQFDNQFTEKIVCLPASSVFLPNKNAPPVNALPALSNGYMTFGSFNRISKISRSVVALWAKLLRVLPDSRMLLGAMPQEGKYQTLIEWFAQEDITQDRLIFHVRGSMDHYLSLHHQVDICLDTFPYNGGTTTFHALWMGVPTLALAGQTVVGWAGVSILGHVGLETFAGQDAADFVQKGVFWANHLAELSNVRAGLRERFAKSARGQPEVVAIGMERALRIMWQRWCAGLPAESFEVSMQEVNNIIQQAVK